MPGGSRVGLLGGTFDPVHNAHLVAALAARHALTLDRVLLVVANRPWQKEGERAITPAGDRLAIVHAALDGVDGLEASDIEIQRGGSTYTVDTVEQLRALDPDADLVLVIGTDVATELDTWHRHDDLRALVDLAVVARPGTGMPDLPGWRATRVDMPLLEISSTDVRRRVGAGEPIHGLVPAAVVRQINARGLYARP